MDETDETERMLPHQVERIFVAIDLAVKRIEKLSMISSLCHYLAEDEHFTTSNRSKKLRLVLGTEFHSIIVELVSCQKMWDSYENNYKLSEMNKDSYKAGVEYGNGKHDTKSTPDSIQRLLRNDEKRHFLHAVIVKTKKYLEENCVTHSPTTSVVGLLKSALRSKYKAHVHRCFKDLDAESLVNILYLTCASGDEHAEGYGAMQERPSYLTLQSDSTMEENNVMESYYVLHSQPSTSLDESHCSSVFDGKGITNKTLKSMDNSSDEFNTISSREQNLGAILQMKGDTTMADPQYGIKEPTASSWHKQDFVLQYLNDCRKNRSEIYKDWVGGMVCYESESSESVMKLSQRIARLFAQLSKLPSEINIKLPPSKTKSGRSYEEIKCVGDCLCNFRSAATHLLATSTRREQICEFEITFRLLQFSEEQLQSKLNKKLQIENTKQQKLSETITMWTSLVMNAKSEVGSDVRNSIKTHVITKTQDEKDLEHQLGDEQNSLKENQGFLNDTIAYVKQITKSLRGRRHFLEASLESLNRQYDSTMLKFQAKIDELSVDEINNARVIETLQNRFKDIEEKYDEMRATKRLKELLKNMEKAESIKQNWAARRIQVAWRKYRVAKLRRKRLKGRKKGKKKTPPPQDKGKSLTPIKGSVTPDSRSRSKSKTP